jgi:hypothetical protein
MKIFDQQSDRAERKVAAEDGSDLLLGPPSNFQLP